MMRRALLFLLAAGFALVTRAACVEPGGTGGTGVEPGGTGGTGTEAGGGIGGTGARADVDVGLVGVITGFGSICLNGVEVAYDTTTQVTSSQPTELAVGQVVAVRATASAGQLRAQRIEVLDPAVGPVSAFDRVTGLFQVAGLQVRIQRATVLAGVSRETLGEGVVRVSGLMHNDGTLEATRIERAPADAAPQAAETTWPDLRAARMIVQGYVEGIDAGHVSIAGLSFEAGSQLAGALRADQLVRLRIATQPDGRRVVERVDVMRSPLDARPERTIGNSDVRSNRGDLNPERSGSERSGSNSGGDSSNSGRPPDRPDRPDRIDRSGPPDRPERVERPSGPGGGPGRH